MEADSRARLLSCCPHASCIRVPSTFVGKDGATVYLLEVTWWPALHSDVDGEGLSWTLSKRFREFDALALELVPFGSVPELPPKQVFGNRKPAVIEARRLGVEAFLTQCTSTPAIANSSVFIRFLEVEQHCEGVSLPRSWLVAEVVARRVRDTGTMLGVTCFHYCLQEDVLLVTREDQSLLSRVDSRISNLAARPDEEVPIGGLLCYKYFEDEGYELVAQEAYQDKATALAFDQERRYVFVGLSSGHVLLYYADLQWSLSAPLADLVCHSLRVSRLCLASDGLLLSISKDRTLRAIDTSRDQLSSVFHAALPTKHWPLALAWNPRRRLAYVSTLGGEILGIEVPAEPAHNQEPKVVAPAVVLKGHKARVQAIHFAEKHLFSGGEAGAAGVWNLQQEDARFCGLLPRGPSAAVSCVTYLRPFKLVATGYANGMVGLWDARGGQLFHIFRAHTTFSASSPDDAIPSRRSSVSAPNFDSLSSSPPASPQHAHSPSGRSLNKSSSTNFSSGSLPQPSPAKRMDDGLSWTPAASLVFEEFPASPSFAGCSTPPPIIRRTSKPLLPSKPLPRVGAQSPVSTTVSMLLRAAEEAAAEARLEPLSVGKQPLPERARKEEPSLACTSGTSVSTSAMPSHPSVFQFPRSSSQPTLPSSCIPSPTSHSAAASLWSSTSSAPSFVPPPAAPAGPVVGVEVRWLWFDELTYTLLSCSDQEVRFWSFPSTYCQPLHVALPPSVCPQPASAKLSPSPLSSPVDTRSPLSSELSMPPSNLMAPDAGSVVIHATSANDSTASCASPVSHGFQSLSFSASDPQSAAASPQTLSAVSGRASTSNSGSVSSVRSDDSSGSEFGESKNDSSISKRGRSRSNLSVESGYYERNSMSRRCSHGQDNCSCSRGKGRGAVEPCARCALNVFPANRVDIQSAAYHTWCLRCRQCGVTLTLPFQGQLYCSAHQPSFGSPPLHPDFNPHLDIRAIPE